MSTHTDRDHGKSAAGTGYEPRDASPKPIVVSGFFLVLLMGFGFLGGWFFWQSFESIEKAQRPRTSPIYERNIPGGPRLQADPAVVWREYERNQREFLDSYGWIDKSAGVARVPVDVAMKAIIENGHLPDWSQSSGMEEP